MEHDHGISVLMEPRPRCIAFLVDTALATDELLDAIINFNVDCWGGRLNPIVPTKDRKVCADFWRLLRLSDPDLIYCYGEIDRETIERLDAEFGPIHIVANRMLDESSPLRYTFSSLRDQASTKGLIAQLRDLFPGHFRIRNEPSILTFDIEHHDERLISGFVRRNFGVSRNAYFMARDERASATVLSSFSNEEVMATVAKSFNLVLPIHLSEKGVRRRRALRDGHQDDSFAIFYGDHFGNAIHYWNHVYFRGTRQFWSVGVDDMWLTPTFVSDTTLYSALLNLVRRKVFANGQRALKLLSCDHDTPELDDLAKRICTDVRGVLYPTKSEKFSVESFPEFSQYPEIPFYAARRNHQFVSGRRLFLGIDQPPDLSPEPDKRWMLRLWIQDPDHEMPYINIEAWWKLPRRQALARAFAGSGRRSRVGKDGELVVEISSGEQNCEIKIPDKHGLFSGLLLPEMQYWTTDDLRHGIPSPTKGIAIGTSDKGKYGNGLFALFGSMSNATYFFEHPFWLPVLTELCRPEVSAHVRNEVSATIKEQAPSFVMDYQNCQDEAIAWFAEEMIQAAHKIPRAENTLYFERLRRDLDTFSSGLTSDLDRECASRINLKWGLRTLTESGALLQGFEITCEHCMSRFWYHVNDVRTVIECTGCRRAIPLPVEKSWCYKPNELLWKAVRYHGLVPVIRTIRRLFDDARESFIFAAGIVFYDYTKDSAEKINELDLAWIKDGEFGIGEIKQSADLFKNKDCENLIAIAKSTKPATALLAAMTGEDAKLARWRDKVDSALSPLGIKTEVWGPSFFARHNYRVW